jgi:hypothetical protein
VNYGEPSQWSMECERLVRKRVCVQCGFQEDNWATRVVPEPDDDEVLEKITYHHTFCMLASTGGATEEEPDGPI